jgi:hypothetical protein
LAALIRKKKVADNYLEKIIYANKHLNIFLPSSAIVPVLKFALYAVDENLKKIFSGEIKRIGLIAGMEVMKHP